MYVFRQNATQKTYINYTLIFLKNLCNRMNQKKSFQFYCLYLDNTYIIFQSIYLYVFQISCFFYHITIRKVDLWIFYLADFTQHNFSPPKNFSVENTLVFNFQKIGIALMK